MDFSNKAVAMLLKSVLGSLNIDGNALMLNVTQFQQFVMSCIQKHDGRLVAIEVQLAENNRLLNLIVEKQNDGRNQSTSLRLANGSEYIFESGSEEHRN